MKSKILYLIGICLSGLTAQVIQAQPESELKFTKIKNQKSLTVKLPVDCYISILSGKPHSGTIYKKQDSLVYFSFPNPDMALVNSIANDRSLKNKRRQALLDSIFIADADTLVINVNDILNILVMPRDIKEFKYKIAPIIASTLCVASGMCFLTLIGKDPAVLGYLSGGIYVALLPTTILLSALPKQLRIDTWKMEN